MKPRKPPIGPWSESTEKVGYWMSYFACPKFPPHLCGVLFANDRWWMFGDFAPGMERPVWVRTDAWLSQFLFDRHQALMDIGSWLWAGKSWSDQALLQAKYPSKAALTAYYEAEARRLESQVLDDTFKMITAPAETTQLRHRYGGFQMRLDNPSPTQGS